MYFRVIVHPNVDTKLLSEILYLYLEFIKFTFEKAAMHAQVVANIFKIFLIATLSIRFLFKLKFMKLSKKQKFSSTVTLTTFQVLNIHE